MWTLDGIRIYVQTFPKASERIIAEINPLGGGTVYQTFGYKNMSFRLTGLIVGETDESDINGLAQTGTTYSLVTPYNTLSVYVKRVNTSQRAAVSQSLRSDLDCTAPVYDVDIELGLA